jgi:chorismate dehydratase
MLAKCEAALLIGDPALKVDRSLYHTWDLAEEWIRFTGKPFVFAFWAVRNQAAQISNLELSAIFQKSRDHGLESNNLRQTAVTWAAKLKITEQRILDYLTSNIYYYLDDECLDGLRLFYQYAHECGVLPRVPDLNFVSTTPALI